MVAFTQAPSSPPPPPPPPPIVHVASPLQALVSPPAVSPKAAMVVGVADEIEADEDRPSTPAPAPAPSPSPPPIVAVASPLQALVSPPPVPTKAAMVGVADENEAEEERPSTPAPSSSPPPPPPPVAPVASRTQALVSPPPVHTKAMVGRDLRENPRRPSTPSSSPYPSPSPSPSREEDGPLEEGDGAAAWLQAEAGPRLQLQVHNPSSSLRDASAPNTDLLQQVQQAGGGVAVQEGDAGLDVQQAKSGDRFRAVDDSRPIHAVPPSAPLHCSVATDVEEDDPLDAANLVDGKNGLAYDDGDAPDGLAYDDGDAPDGLAYGLGSSENGDAKDDQEAVEQCVIGKEFAAMDNTVMGGIYAAKDETSAEYQEKNVEQCATYDSKNIMKAPIKITIIEKVDVEASETRIKSSEISGKMVVKFRPDIDRLVDTLDGIGFTPYARVDRELFNMLHIMRSQRFPEGFDLLKWYKKKARIRVPLRVTTHVFEDPYTKEHIKGVNMNNVEVTCIPMGETNMHNIVVTIPLPSVDHVGIARKTRSHVWKNRGTHIERENLIEWNIPYLGASDKRAMMVVDAFCYDGWQEPSQFFPVKIEFSYELSIASEVEYVARSGDGRQLEFQKETLGRCSYVINHPKELARRAAAAADEALAWQQGPWEPWEDEEEDFA